LSPRGPGCFSWLLVPL